MMRETLNVVTLSPQSVARGVVMFRYETDLPGDSAWPPSEQAEKRRYGQFRLLQNRRAIFCTQTSWRRDKFGVCPLFGVVEQVESRLVATAKMSFGGVLFFGGGFGAMPMAVLTVLLAAWGEWGSLLFGLAAILLLLASVVVMFRANIRNDKKRTILLVDDIRSKAKDSSKTAASN